MAYTLISILGTGMYQEGYKQTNYIFPDHQEFETKYFLEALLKCQYRDFNKLILVGTKTSSWDILINNPQSENEEKLWEAALTESSSKEGITDELLKKIETYLQEKLNMPIVLKVHTPTINDESTAALFECYSSIIPEISKDSDVLFDITHGFRSMPLLLYQALQYSLMNNNSNRKIEVVYGEYNKKTKNSIVRSLNNYWKFTEISNALNVFKSKLDGFHLADLIEKEWPDGAKVIRKLSEIVQTNFCLQFIDVAKQIKNVLSKYTDTMPTWTLNIKEELEKLLALVDEKSVARTLYNLSVFYYNLQLYTQAVITLQVAVETSVAEKENRNDCIGSYDWWTDEGWTSLHTYVDKIDSKELKISHKLNNLSNFRNNVAHGGGKNRKAGFPNTANTKNIYESGKTGVELLFKNLGI